MAAASSFTASDFAGQGHAQAPHRLDRAHTVRKGQLVETTPEVNREVPESAMLLSQGARRAIEMKREATEADAHVVPAAAD
jgi:hypothetical protein